MFDRPDRFDSTVTWRFLKIDFMIPLLKRQCSLPNASQSAITASHAIPLQNSRDESTPRPRLIIVPLNAHNRRLRTLRMRAQTRSIRNIPLVPHNIRGLQLPKEMRIVSPVRALAMVLVSGHPIVVRLLPLLRDIGLERARYPWSRLRAARQCKPIASLRGAGSSRRRDSRSRGCGCGSSRPG
jgi:hypothetical protein